MSHYYDKNSDLSFVSFTPEQERDLFTRFKGGDIEARDAIVQNYLKFAASEGLKAAKGRLLEADAISAANYALMRAIEGYSPDMDVCFAGYARQFIKGRIKHAVNERAKERKTINLDAALHSKEEKGFHTGKELDVELSEEPGLEKSDLTMARLAKVREMLPRLTPTQRQVVEGLLFENHTFSTLSRKLRISRQAVRKVFLLASATMKEILAEEPFLDQ